ncbi:MAG: hypothetical protein U0X91_31675 [Spirosomataceae bacterium]
MKKRDLLTYFFLLICLHSLSAQTQNTDSSFYKPLDSYQLKPITIAANGRYYYGGQRLRSNYSMEIPFGELDDPEVNRYFKNSRTIRTVGSVVSALPGIYYLVAGRNNGISRQTFWATYLGAIGVSLTANLIANVQMRKAVNTYNSRLVRPRFGLSVQEMPNNALAVGMGLKIGMGN